MCGVSVHIPLCPLFLRETLPVPVSLPQDCFLHVTPWSSAPAGGLGQCKSKTCTTTRQKKDTMGGGIEMKRYTGVVTKLLVFSAVSLLISCATGQQMTQNTGRNVEGGQVVDAGSFTVRAPLEGEWQVKVDRADGSVQFTKRIPLPRHCNVWMHTGLLHPGEEKRTEDDIARSIFDFEEKNMRERGATRSYTPTRLSREVTDIAGKRLYLMSYTMIDRGHAVPMEFKYAMYLYFPPNLKQKRTYYNFIIGEISKIMENTYETDLTIIESVIESFRQK
jgi:hypothetical protein